ncbi:MAG TPA: ABC transporter ATP-binding protein, partial [Ignavibacteriaceae bacterium]|nr:ABC transporter ATP-binding protein [Ignavibacteriaceae bacterium]
MNEYAVKVQGVSKQYLVNKPDFYNNSLREAITRIFKEPSFVIKQKFSHKKKFWALQNINFNVRHGEIVGIIGHNGAGKSTLLKILSRITEPTTGRCEVYGRVGSLLEVGTGFHWELTGRENIFLNGAILGMKKAEIKRKFDEIVAFAEIDEFLDTPVKRYSTGMYVKLAFAIAAHLEPDILIIDEVLSVGDIAFQRKCLGKINEVANTGRTVLFVSHNMGTIQSLCSRVILLKNGQLFTDGSVEETLSAYLSLLEKNSNSDLLFRTDRKGKGRCKITCIEIYIPDIRSQVLMTGKPACFSFHISNIPTG